jgi:hypothetical protein
MLLKSRCTQHRKTIKNSRPYMNSPCTSNQPFLTHLLWESLEVMCTEIKKKNKKKCCNVYFKNILTFQYNLIHAFHFTECGGKMHLREGEFEKAHTDFFEAFKNYDESGSPRRTTCLKYLVLANM